MVGPSEQIFDGLPASTRNMLRLLYRHLRTGYQNESEDGRRKVVGVAPKSIEESRYRVVMAANIIKLRRRLRDPNEPEPDRFPLGWQPGNGPLQAGPPLVPRTRSRVGVDSPNAIGGHELDDVSRRV